MAAQVCDNRYAVEERAKVLCSRHMQCDGEAAVEGVIRSSPQVRIRMVRVMGCGCDPVAFGTEMAKALGHMHGIEMTERARGLVSAAGMKAQEIQLGSETADIGKREQERPLESTPGSLWEVLAKLRESTVGNLKVARVKLLAHTAGNLSEVLAKLRENTADSFLVVPAKQRGTDRDVALVEPVRLLCTDHGTVVGVQVILPCVGCSAALEALVRQLEHNAAGS
jgi:hypothetical protein